MIELQTAKTILRADEGYREKPYYCSEGYPTIGYGLRIWNKGEPLPKISMSPEDAEKQLTMRCEELGVQLVRHHVYRNLDVVRRATLLSMAYQLGISGLFGFKKMWAALESCNYSEAAAECMDSKAARQAPNRFNRNAGMINTGILDAYYR